VFVVPVAASVLAGWEATRLLPHPHGKGEFLGVLAVLVVVSTAALLVVDWFARRLLPLAGLLELSMLFPDRAPSRLSVARDAIRRLPIEEQLRRVREAGGDPSVAAREVLALLAALQQHDRPTRGHAERVRVYTDLIAEQLKLPERDRDLLRWSAILHDVGKLLVPPVVLNKPGPPDDQEWAVLRAHPQHGADVTGPLLPWLGEWGDVIVQHHEKWDGSGYPGGLSRRSICLGARIVAVADAYDVMTSTRPYKRPISRAAAFRELVRAAGTQFDPTMVRAMVSVTAPRLRRAQGVVAWLADIPVLATSTVPAATLARVVGAGAIATTTLTGGFASPPAVAPPSAAAGHGPGVVSQHTEPAASSGQIPATHPARAVLPQSRDGRSAEARQTAAASPMPSATATPTANPGAVLPPIPGVDRPPIPGVDPLPIPGTDPLPIPSVNPPKPVASVIQHPVATVTSVAAGLADTVNKVTSAAGGLPGSVVSNLPIPPALPDIPLPDIPLPVDVGKLLGK
jgi:hypothetical protein